MTWKRPRPPTKDTCVHLISRTVDGDLKFSSAEDKRMISDLIKRTATFCSIHLNDHSVLGNHYHIECHVPPRPREIPRETVLTKIEDFYQGKALEAVLRKWDQIEALEGERGLERFADSFRARMYDMAQYMKTVNQLITIRFNKRHHRKGTLWQSRYKSLLVQGDPAALALRTVAAYIDLNPVRAGLVSDPGSYPFSTYGEAVAGNKEARKRLMSVLPKQGDGSWEAFNTAYKELLYESEERKRGPEAAERLARAMHMKRKPESVQKAATARREMEQREKEPGSHIQKAKHATKTYGANEILLQTVRVFKDGLALGDKKFVESVFQANRELFGTKRKTGARPISVCPDWRGQLYAARDLRKEPITNLTA